MPSYIANSPPPTTPPSSTHIYIFTYWRIHIHMYIYICIYVITSTYPAPGGKKSDTGEIKQILEDASLEHHFDALMGYDWLNQD